MKRGHRMSIVFVKVSSPAYFIHIKIRFGPSKQTFRRAHTPLNTDNGNDDPHGNVTREYTDKTHELNNCFSLLDLVSY